MVTDYERAASEEGYITTNYRYELVLQVYFNRQWMYTGFLFELPKQKLQNLKDHKKFQYAEMRGKQKVYNGLKARATRRFCENFAQASKIIS